MRPLPFVLFWLSFVAVGLAADLAIVYGLWALADAYLTWLAVKVALVVGVIGAGLYMIAEQVAEQRVRAQERLR